MVVVSRICGCRRWKASKGCFLDFIFYLRRLLFQPCFKDSFNYPKMIEDGILLIVCSYYWHGKITVTTSKLMMAKTRCLDTSNYAGIEHELLFQKLFKIQIHLLPCQPMKVSFGRLSWLYSIIIK